MSPVVTLDRVTKSYGELVALDEVTLAFPRGRFVAVMGPSGSGKSTMLHCAAALDPPTSGSVLIGEVDVSGLSETRRTQLRRKHMGFVFQSYNLLPAITVEDNITLPLRLAGVRADRDWLGELVDELGQTVVMVTHDPAAAARAHDTLVMADGKVIEVLDAPTPEDLAVRLTRLTGEPVA
ncbi:putative ABC transport system ATP-binding protein [Streptosporangium canum]|uniref:Putative ABC transport system ATP-binding protein n=1 Tax=Streptosporangium canum TaxID=324952 RepID=A0A1I3GRL1_9ACTN|nr:ABC transporter ATP-binding protein [Streptosporangium canum]SFI26026.1 putative ABC transport system ATP-binding protein [Streptosporangium canum]